ncbi:acetyltransferase [Sphaerisporangium melleum]|uniref:Acetyltransferase n=1 Tax=Sphaerisporangium melleum TaxID=321316 RepID=A0A917VQX8_9ACTN|nr:GNAT family N-acetyltransferase [Sphaerisporangium melleum]GGL05647.1 acetyltransferase [Sphaerisporangium melleum]GII73179.1 acetyltransferase [Sphaerisporangium melleum]
MDSTTDLRPQFDNARDYYLSLGHADRSDGDPALYRSGVPHSLLNGVLRLGDKDVDEALAEARGRLDGVPWWWWIGADSRSGVEEALLTRGGAFVQPMPVMAVSLDRVADVPAPAGLTVEQVTASGIREWVQTFAPAFSMSPALHEDISRIEAARAGHPGTLIRFAARIDGQMVGTAALFDAHGVAGIYAVSTVETHRRRGIGAHLTTVALHTGRERGLRVGTLQASSAGAHVYRGMGFETVAEYHIFQLPPA